MREDIIDGMEKMRVEKMNVIIWGASEWGIKVKKGMEKLRHNVKCFIDNNEAKQGMPVDGIEVVSFSAYLSMNPHENDEKIIIATKNIEAITVQLFQSGVRKDVFGLKRSFFENEKIDDIEKYLVRITADRPLLSYIEYQVVDHCNLKCKGCLHYSNIVAPAFGDIKAYEKDLERLSELFGGIITIRLLGGEPLLCNRLDEYIGITKEYFPDADIRVATNGLLIPYCDEKVLQIMSENDVIFDITQYPPTKKVIDTITKRCDEMGVAYCISEVVDCFYRYIDKDNPDKIDETFRMCSSKQCHFLRDGHLSICPRPILYKDFSDQLSITRELSGGIVNIHDKKWTGEKLLSVLNSPINYCRYCSEIESFTWQRDCQEQ